MSALPKGVPFFSRAHPSVTTRASLVSDNLKFKIDLIS